MIVTALLPKVSAMIHLGLACQHAARHQPSQHAQVSKDQITCKLVAATCAALEAYIQACNSCWDKQRCMTALAAHTRHGVTTSEV